MHRARAKLHARRMQFTCVQLPRSWQRIISSPGSCEFWREVVFCSFCRAPLTLKSRRDLREFVASQGKLDDCSNKQTPRASALHNWVCSGSAANFACVGHPDQIRHTFTLLIRTSCNSPTASIPAGVRSHCILIAKDLRKFVYSVLRL